MEADLPDKIRTSNLLTDTEKGALLHLVDRKQKKETLYVSKINPLGENFLRNILRWDKSIHHDLTRRSFQIIRLGKVTKSPNRIRGYRDHGTLPENYPNSRPKIILTKEHYEIEKKREQVEQLASRPPGGILTEDLFTLNPNIFDP
jgi:hypothetical protein